MSLDKLYVYFDMDAHTYARFLQGKQGTAASGDPCQGRTLGSFSLELTGASTSPSGGQTAQFKGQINWVNNQFNPATDTILVRGVFDNPRIKEGTPRLRPGMFVRVTVDIGQPHPELLVPDPPRKGPTARGRSS